MRSQRGDALLEGLVALALFAIIALGITYALVRSTASQRLGGAQNLLIGKLRSSIQANGIADGCPTAPGQTTTATLTLPLTTGANDSVTKSCTMTTVTLTPAVGTPKTVNIPSVTFTSSSGTSSNFDTAVTLRN